MVWQKEIEKLEYRKGLAYRMGGRENVARHHARGKLTVRERIAALADPGSFEEIGTLAGSARYDGDELVSFSPSNIIIGSISLDGRRMVVNGGDFTVRGGAADAAITQKRRFAEQMAMDWRLPYIRLIDATGGSVRTFEQIGHTYVPTGTGESISPKLMQVAPIVSVVMGSVAGLPAVEACLAHFNVMVKGTSQLFVAGPPVVKASSGHEITKEELGNERVHAYESGVINNVAESEEEAFRIIKRFLSYMPTNVYEMPPRITPSDDRDRRDEELLSIIPRDRKKTYDPYTILRCVFDHNSIFEISPFFGRSRITSLARINGYPVAVMINNPNFLGGAMDVAAAEKVIRFVEMCDTFHLPMVYFVDEPGFMVGLKSEKQGMVRTGARVHCIVDQSTMPWISFIMRQVYGVAGGCHIRASGMHKRYAWPSGNWGSMHIEGGAMAAYRREIEAAPDPEAKRIEIEARLKSLTSPFKTAQSFNIEEIIDPRESRPLLVKFIETAQGILKSQLGPSTGPSYRP